LCRQRVIAGAGRKRPVQANGGCVVQADGSARLMVNGGFEQSTNNITHKLRLRLSRPADEIRMQG
jgi:hypothetical protein